MSTKLRYCVVTGASSGIGMACASALIETGYTVYGVARDFSKCTIAHDRFIPCACDLTDHKALDATVTYIRKETKRSLDILLNCAGCGTFAPHEEISHAAIRRMIALNIEAPLMLTSCFLRDIRARKGFIINIASITAMHPAPKGCAYAATKAGLLHFSRSLFEETRRSGIKVVCIIPDITRTAFFDDLNFAPEDDPEAFIEPECIARAVTEVISQRNGTVITELVIRPQKFMVKRHSTRR